MFQDQRIHPDAEQRVELFALPRAPAQTMFPPFAPARSYSRSSPLFQQGEPSCDVFFVNSGIVKTNALDLDGQEVIVSVCGAGWLLGADSAILNEVYQSSAATVTECRLQRISSKNLRNLLRTDPELSWRIHQILSLEARIGSERLAALASQPAKVRLTRFLSRAILGCRCGASEARVLNLPLKQWEIAQLLGITPEHINRLLRHLEQDGVVLRRKAALVLSNPRKLLEMAACTCESDCM